MPFFTEFVKKVRSIKYVKENIGCKLHKGDLRDDGHILKRVFIMILNIFQLSQPMCQLYKIPISTRFILSYANNVYLGDIILVMIALTLQCTNEGSQGRWNVLGRGGHCVFKWILRGHLKPPPCATI